MPRRRLVRFLVEVAFLGGLATLATVARMHAGAVVAVMAFGWVVVALAEWSSWLDRPHFGRGLPPRFYIPQVSLPPPEPIEQRSTRLPSGGRRVEDEETWIATSSDWPTAFDDWPVLDLERLGDDTGIVRATPPAEDTEAGTIVVPLEEPAAQLPDEPGAPDPNPSPGPVDLRITSGQIPGRSVEAEPAPEPPLVRVPAPESGPESEQEVLAVAPGEKRRVPGADTVLARHRIDPFAPAGRARRWRPRREGSGVVEVPDRPPLDRPLPSALGRERSAGTR